MLEIITLILIQPFGDKDTLCTQLSKLSQLFNLNVCFLKLIQRFKTLKSGKVSIISVLLTSWKIITTTFAHVCQNLEQGGMVHHRQGIKPKFYIGSRLFCFIPPLKGQFENLFLSLKSHILDNVIFSTASGALVVVPVSDICSSSIQQYIVSPEIGLSVLNCSTEKSQSVSDHDHASLLTMTKIKNDPKSKMTQIKNDPKSKMTQNQK